MAEGNGDPKMDHKEELDKSSSEPHSEDYSKLIEYGLDEKVASKLDEIYKTGKLAHADLDERALDALKEFPVDGALNVLTQFLDSNLEHVSNKSAFLCGVMKTYRQKSRAGQTSQVPTTAKAPDEDKIRAILDRTGYTLDVTTGQRKYGGPPPNWEKPTPGNGCEVFCGKIPRDMYEDELIPLFEKCGKIWDLRLMMDPMTGQNRGYAFVTFTSRDAAQQAVRELDSYEIKPGKTLKVNISVPNLRLFVGNIPKSRGKEEIMEEFGKLTAGLTEVIIYSSPDDKKKNRGFCFLEYESHKAASLAKRRLGTGRVKVWGCDIIVDWADPQEEPDEETMSKVKVLYVRNLTQDCTEEKLKESFESFGKVERVKKIKDYAFVHFEDRDQAVLAYRQAMNELNGKDINGAHIEVSLAKPPSDKKKKEEMLRARERRMMQMIGQRAGIGIGPRGGPGGTPLRGGLTRGDYDYDYDYYGYGDYRGGYSDPYFDDYYRYDDYYYDYALHPSAAPRGRGRQPQPAASRGRGVVARGRAGGPPGMPQRGRGTPSRGGANNGGTRGKANNNGTRGATTAAAKEAAAAKSAGPSLPGKRKFDGGHQNQGESKRRFQTTASSGGNNGGEAGGSSSSAASGGEGSGSNTWGSQPIPQQPLSASFIGGGVNGGNTYCSPNSGGGGDQQWYQDSYGQSWN
ncbi:heterogeneous nuclear ribonucleoprotein R isoform X3 [Neocloeon triangulifer]|uniref:heterogeneous nuclear ribonucleoprotein R isoform X3 n=1 Tax=Neocloeon triangulifer TaxID=2078957 RepID=UPI00286F3EE7|nr:heterogeneous nuclear ribonucleoprotein R isoform X3 [Neocloeon triangulifer]